MLDKMNEKQLIKEIKRLKEIKPSKDWVFSVKDEILGQELEHKTDWLSVFTFVPRHKMAFATLTIVFVLVGVFGWAQSSLPGEFFYPMKKAVERAQINLLSAQTERPNLKLELVSKRLSDIAEIAETNHGTKLASAVEEFRVSTIEAAEGLKTVENTEKVVMEVKRIEAGRQSLEALGIMVGETEELDNALAELVERELKDLKNRALNEAQTEFLKQAQTYYESGGYSQALENILRASQVID